MRRNARMNRLGKYKSGSRNLLRLLFFLFVFTSMSIVASGAEDESFATMVIVGRVWTGDAHRPSAEAVAVRHDRIIFVGSRDDAQKFRGGQTQVVDAGNGLVVPGLIDSHIHLIDGGLQLAVGPAARCEVARGICATHRRVRQKKAPGEWITGGDWDHTLWGGELPSRDWIDAVTPDNPVWLNRLDGHMSLANSAAMRAAKVVDDVKDVPGGEIVRDQGRPADGRVQG